MAEPAASMRVWELGQDDIKVEVRFWTDSRRVDFVATTSKVRSCLVIALRDAGIDLPDPDVRILVLRHLGQWQSTSGTVQANT